MTDSHEPRTEAGRDYIDTMFGRKPGNVTLTEQKAVAWVRRIEAEARAEAEPEREGLDAAWAAAEAALPEGWTGPSVIRAYTRAEWDAQAVPPLLEPYAHGYGPTPAAALRALAARFTPTSPSSEETTRHPITGAPMCCCLGGKEPCDHHPEQRDSRGLL